MKTQGFSVASPIQSCKHPYLIGYYVILRNTTNKYDAGITPSTEANFWVTLDPLLHCMPA